MALDKEKLMQELRDLGATILDLEAEIKPLRTRRDRLIVRGLEMQIPILHMHRVSGVSRAWINHLKRVNGMKRRKYVDGRTSQVRLARAKQRVRTIEDSIEAKRINREEL